MITDERSDGLEMIIDEKSLQKMGVVAKYFIHCSFHELANLPDYHTAEDLTRMTAT